MPCYSPIKGWIDKETGGIKFRKDSSQDEEAEVSCSACLGCRLDRANMWANRITHEAAVYRDKGGACFITLTYRDRSRATEYEKKHGYYIPDNWSLSKPGTHKDGRTKGSHFQSFIKRLRKHVKKEDEAIAALAGTKPAYRKIKYYHCGEYGRICEHRIDLELHKCPQCNVGRPHYHAIIFGYTFPDREPYMTKEDGTPRYTSPTLERIWRYGIVDVGDVTIQSAGYVARYCLKKITGEQAKDHYRKITDEGEVITLDPEYASMSNGIGKEWLERYERDFYPVDETPVLGDNKIIKGTPRYYLEQLKEKDPVTYCRIKAARENHLEENAEEYTPERLMAKYKVKKAKIRPLERKL